MPKIKKKKKNPKKGFLGCYFLKFPKSIKKGKKSEKTKQELIGCGKGTGMVATGVS